MATYPIVVDYGGILDSTEAAITSSTYDPIQTAEDNLSILFGTDGSGSGNDVGSLLHPLREAGNVLTGAPTSGQVQSVKDATAAEITAAGGSSADIAKANAAIDAQIKASGGTAEQKLAAAGDSLKIFGLSVITVIVLVLVFLILFELKK